VSYSLVYHVDYMADDGRQEERLLHGIDEEIHTKVAMWNPTTLAETLNIAKKFKNTIYMGM